MRTPSLSLHINTVKLLYVYHGLTDEKDEEGKSAMMRSACGNHTYIDHIQVLDFTFSYSNRVFRN